MIARLLNIQKLLGNSGSAFLLGARGTGKTMLSKAFMKGQRGLTIELLKGESFTRYLAHPELFRKEIENQIRDDLLTVYVDEIQKLPNLLDEVHQLLSEYEGRVRFLLTGSSSRKLKRRGANMLAGRAYLGHLFPLTFLEHTLPIETLLSFGSLPGIVLKSESPANALRAYFETYLREEIIEEAVTRRLDSFSRFLELAAQYDGKIVNFSELSRKIGSAPNTVASYFEILEQTLVVVRLPGWSHSISKQLRAASKFYFFDCGVLNAIRRELNHEVSPGTNRFGDLFENMVINEFHRLNSYFQRDLSFYYWQTKEGQEVDLICAANRFSDPIAVEIKSGTAPTKEDIKHLNVFAKDYPRARLYCLCRTPSSFKIDNVLILPWQDGIKEILKI